MVPNFRGAVLADLTGETGRRAWEGSMGS